VTAGRPSLSPTATAHLVAVLDQSRTLGFLGPGPVSAHIDLALDLATILVDLAPARALDLGSGGGVPGLVLLMALPQLDMVLLDAAERRTRFLEHAVHELGLESRARVWCGRAEEAGRDPELRHRFDAVVARSFGPPATTAECGAPFLRAGGHLLVTEPPVPVDRWPADGLAQLGLRRPDHPVPLVDSRVAVFRADALCPDRFPRRTGMPAKRPLFVSRET
jgi:16S rRNA (guanine527-N7)-methyltransferase